MFKKTILKNNLRLILIPLKESKSVTVTFNVKGGSRFEKERQGGIAHFLEHLSFKGTEEYRSQFELAKLVEGFGGEWNASTGLEEISYFIRAASSHAESLFHILDQMLFYSLYKEEDIEKEKGVIIEEINMYNDLPQYRASHISSEITWPSHPLGRDIAGTKSTVSSFTKEDLVKFNRDFFTPSNMVLGVAGSFDSDGVTELISERFGRLADSKSPAFVPYSKKDEGAIKVEERDSEQTHLRVAFRAFSRKDSRKYALKLISMILGGGISSRLFQKIRTELGLAYYISCHTELFMDTGAIFISGGVNNSMTARALKEILGEVKKLTSEGVSIEELERNKEHLKGRMAIELEDQENLNSFYLRQELLNDEILTYEETIKLIDTVDLDMIEDVAEEIFNERKMTVAVVGKTKEALVKEAVSI